MHAALSAGRPPLPSLKAGARPGRPAPPRASAFDDQPSTSDNSRDWRNRARSQKGDSFERVGRRRGRPAWTRNPDDSPLRDGNRDRLIGLLTERAAKTLVRGAHCGGGAGEQIAF